MPRKESRDWYDTPLLYDIVFDSDTAREADFLEAVLARHGRSNGCRVLEPACGSARLMRAMAERGYSVAGFDASPAMVAFARRRCRGLRPPARVKPARMEDFAIAGRFDLAHCLLSTFKYLLDGEAAVRHLELVRDHLADGGVYALGIHLTDYQRRRPHHERWVGARDGLRVVCNTRTWPADRRRRREQLRTRLHVTREGGAADASGSTAPAADAGVGEGDAFVQETLWECRTYSPRQFRALLRSVPGLDWVATYDFHHDITSPITLRHDSPDAVAILRRNAD